MKKYQSLLLSALVICFPLFLLIFRWRGGFTSDWYNSLWMTAYQGEYFSQHWGFSPVFNTNDAVGVTFPIFYGYLFYPILALISAVMGPHLALRVAAFAILSLQFVLVKRLVFNFTKDLERSWVTAILMSWSIYPLTNLYNRSAFPEFFATTALLCAFCFWFLMLIEDSDFKKYGNALGFGLTIIIMAGSHPITAFYGLAVLGVMATITSFFHLKKHPEQTKIILGSLVLVALGAGITLSPWVYVVHLFKDKLQISGSMSELTLHQGIDQAWIRFFPLPLDYRSVVSGISTATSGLEAQINFSLFIWLLGCFVLLVNQFKSNTVVFSKQGAAFGMFLILFFAIVNISVGHSQGSVLGKFITKVQLGYRLVTYANLFLFLALIFLYQLPQFSTKKVAPLIPGFSAVILTLSACGVIIKLLHGSIILPEGDRFGYPNFHNYKVEAAQVPKSFYSLDNYTVTGDLKALSAVEVAQGLTLRIPIVGQEHFGDTTLGEFDLKTGAWILTNVYPFPWNRIFLNGTLVESRDIQLANGRLAFWVPQSGHYSVEYRFVPDPLWGVLRTVSFTSLFLILLAPLLYWRRARHLQLLT